MKPHENELLATAPVRFIPSDVPDQVPADGVGLCLSGGGYRAMLYHVGALWRMNEAGLLPELTRVSSVSGGSIVAGLLGLKWSRLDFVPGGVAARFVPEVVRPIRNLAARTIDIPAVLKSLLPFVSASGRIAAVYRGLYGRATLQALPDTPRFVINATNLQSSVLWRFMKPYMRDYRVGEIRQPDVEIARAVAASSAFPPFLSPARFRFRESDFVADTGDDLQRPPFTTDVRLTDGGVYDNLGLETAWKRCRTILVSDAGAKLQPQPHPRSDWVRSSIRVEGVIYDQVGSLRKRQAIAAYQRGERQGTYWGIASHITDYHLPDPLPCPPDRTAALAALPTRLASLSPEVQERLINWGYGICDAALRKHFDSSLPRPAGFPYDGGV